MTTGFLGNFTLCGTLNEYRLGGGKPGKFELSLPPWFFSGTTSNVSVPLAKDML
jgi:hypothetical protein